MFKLIVSLISVIVGSESAKILGVYPTASISHQVVFRPLMLELAKRGHEVTMITTNPAFPKGQAPTNFTEIDVHDVSYKHWNTFPERKVHEKDTIDYITFLCGFITELIEMQIKSDEVQKLLKENKEFDLIFVESYMRPALIFSHIYNAPVIEFSSLSAFLSAFERIGAATHPIIYPNAFRRRVFNLTLWEKLRELYIHFTTERIIAQHIPEENKMLKKLFGPDIPDVEDLILNVQMLFLNVHPIWDVNRPVPPNVVYIGGLHQNPQRDLPQDLKSYFDSSKNGVIYMSLGTNVKPEMLPPDKLKVFTDVFSQLPYDVLWKWDNDELPGQPKNVKISKWLPQSDLLRHPKVKLFITQGGLQSTDETITAGVPVIGIPMLGDQWFNVEQYERFKIGKGFLIAKLTHDQLMDAINNIIGDESYRQNIAKLRSLVHDQPQSSMERAVWWTEYVLRHGGGAYLRAPGAVVSWTEYYEIELVLLLLAVFVAFLAVTVLTINFIVSHIRYYMRKKVKVN